MPSLYRQMQLGFIIMPASLGVQLLAMLLIANHFGPETWGVFAVMLAVMQIAGFVTEMGLGTIITKVVAEAKKPAGDYIAFALPAVIGVAAAVAAIQVVVICIPYPVTLVGGASLLAAANIMLFGTSLVLSCALRGLGRIGQWQAGFLGQKLVLLVAVVALLKPLDGGLSIGMACWTIANTCTLVYYGACLWGREWTGQLRWQPAEMKALVAESIPVGLISVLNQLALHIDTFVVAAMCGRSAVGVYAISQRLVNPARNIVTGAVVTPTFPGLCRLATKGNEELGRRMTRLVVVQWVAGLVMAVGAFVAAPWILPPLLGKGFSDSVEVLQITAWALPAAFFTLQLRYMYIALSRQRRFLGLNLAYVALKTGLLIVLTWYYGIWGACAGTVAAELIMAAIVRIDTAAIKVHLVLAGRLLLATIATAAIVWIIVKSGTHEITALVLGGAYVLIAACVLNRLLKGVPKL